MNYELTDGKMAIMEQKKIDGVVGRSRLRLISNMFKCKKYYVYYVADFIFATNLPWYPPIQFHFNWLQTLMKTFSSVNTFHQCSGEFSLPVLWQQEMEIHHFTRCNVRKKKITIGLEFPLNTSRTYIAPSAKPNTELVSDTQNFQGSSPPSEPNRAFLRPL